MRPLATFISQEPSPCSAHGVRKLDLPLQSSIRPRRAKLAATPAPANSAMSLPGCCLSAAILPATSSRRRWEFCHLRGAAPHARAQPTPPGTRGSTSRRLERRWRGRMPRTHLREPPPQPRSRHAVRLRRSRRHRLAPRRTRLGTQVCEPPYGGAGGPGSSVPLDPGCAIGCRPQAVIVICLSAAVAGPSTGSVRHAPTPRYGT
jgi:hypothetical protein